APLLLLAVLLLLLVLILFLFLGLVPDLHGRGGGLAAIGDARRNDVERPDASGGDIETGAIDATATRLHNAPGHRRIIDATAHGRAELLRASRERRQRRWRDRDPDHLDGEPRLPGHHSQRRTDEDVRRAHDNIR